MSIEAIVFCFHHFVLSQCFERVQALLKVKLKVTKGVFLQLRNKFELPAKTNFSNILTAIGVTAVSYF